MTVVTDRKAFSKTAVPVLATDRKRLAKFLERLTPEERRWVASSGFEGAPHTHCLFPGTEGDVNAVLVGVRDARDPWALASLPLKLPPGRYALGKGPVDIAPADAAFAWDLGGYQFTRYKSARRKPSELQLAPGTDVTRSMDLAQAVRLVRDLVNTPAEHLGPGELAAEVREQAKLFGGKFREWVGEQLLASNFPAIHAVGRAAERAPRLLEITWGNPKHPRLAIVGKGVCFDTGGLDIKTAEGMRLMKKDMGGAAHALALARLVMQRKLPVFLHLLIPAVENSISANAYRPGDVVRTRQGHTVEIGNTDAEGRVVLCDALAYAVEHHPKTVVDFATLTGAARVALGPELPAYFCNDDRLAARIERGAKTVEDPVWRMPLWRSYRRLFDSDVADFNNSGKAGYGGAIVAALFLDYFVPQDIAWAHFDTFAWNDISRPGRPAGGEALGLRAMLAALS